MQLSQFKAALGNVARPNLFQAKLSGYQRVAIGVDVEDTFTFRCEAAEVPGRTVLTTDDQGHGGPAIKMASDITYNDITLTIICSEDMKERFFFERWMDAIVSPVGTSTAGLVGFYEDYAMNTILEVNSLNSSNQKIYTSTMYYVYPTTLTPMSASWEDTNTYQRFQVTLNYRFYTYTRYT